MQTSYCKFDPQLSVAEAIEYESLPEHIRGLAEKYLGTKIDEINELRAVIEDIDYDLEAAEQRGFRRGIVEGTRLTNARWRKELADLSNDMGE